MGSDDGATNEGNEDDADRVNDNGGATDRADENDGVITEWW